ncbi:YcaO-like family protein [Halosimplex rubrum]|uniref:YcaO-like family protein n=1 Tax=Halosimplex rubrum TaxID=869889 RepID=A0A7D5T1P9_9EURY|nr:YcaO-like family protein [Halosimplex rubrum]QLH79128.1 YcaO-like family protein [Halosimplex rubrum]
MTVELVGSGPAADAVAAALGDADEPLDRPESAAFDPGTRLAVVVDRAGAATFERANGRAREAGVPWVAVELGGIGGVPVVDAAVAAFDPEGACYRCLAARVESNADPDADPTAAPADATVRFAGAVAGRRAVQLLDPAEADPLGTAIELPHTEREFLPVPGCECGEGRDSVLDRGHLDRDVERSLSRAERGLDDRVGVVQQVGEAESYPAPYYLAQICDTGAFADATASRQAAGVDPGWDAAFMKALGEAYERYCAGVYHGREFKAAAATDLADAVAPSEFVRPESWVGNGDGGVDAGGDRAERPWVPGTDLVTERPVSLPAEAVHYPPPERTIRPAVTTGLGLGNSSVEALLSGLYEVVERDATTIAWYSTYEPLGLDVADPGYERLAARAGAEGLEATALLLTQDVDVPVVAVAVTREQWPALALGTAADLDAGRAARDALAEAVQNWVELDGMGREGAAETDGAIGHYADRPPVVDAFVSPETTVDAASVGPETVPEGGAHLDAVLDRVVDAGCSAYAARTTTRDVGRLGFEAVRVVVPTAQPLFFGDPYFGERARSVPADMGFEPALDRDHHPYP